MSLRLVVPDLSTDVRDTRPIDPRDPTLYRGGLSKARAALREGRARQHARAASETSAALPGDRDGDRDVDGEGGRDA